MDFFDVPRRQRKTRRCRRRVVLAATAVVMMALALAGRHHEIAYREITVGRGESLWLIVSETTAGAYVPRAVNDVRQANKLPDSRLWPGMTIYVPVSYRPVWAWQDRHIGLPQEAGGEVAKQ